MKEWQGIQVLQNGNITTPKGFSAGGLHIGIRKEALDLGWIYSEIPATAAAVYTLNTFQAAPLTVTKQSLNETGKVQGVIVNSGNANAVTGELGYENALQMQRLTAEKLQIDQHHTVVASTGVIGVQLPMDKITQGINNIELEKDANGENFEQAILTTDRVTKRAAVEININGKTITIAGAAKGSGMIAPNMATMLSFITTDANVNEESLQQALRKVTNASFNMITVDGDTSTNDMVLVMANGMQGNDTLDESHPEWNDFLNGLQYVATELAKKIAKDGEGATKLVEVHVEGAASKSTAGKIAKAVISSNLVKAAIYGTDPNWGRIVAAMGYSGEVFDPNKVAVSLGEVTVVDQGLPLDFSEAKAKEHLEKENVMIKINLNSGNMEAKAWGCDLTYEYVRINASYRT